MHLSILAIFRPLFFVLHHIKVWFRNIKLHWKIQLLIFFIMMVAYVTTFSLFHHSISIYDKQLYADSANILNLSMQNIENEMYNLLSSVSNLATDTIVQDTIRDIENADSEYKEYTNRQALMNRLYISLNKKKYILSVNYIDQNLRIDSVGADTSIFLSAKVQQLYDTAFSQNGKPVWINPNPEEKALILLCPIREVDQLKLRPMGVIAIRIQLEKLVQNTMDIDTDAEENFYIYNNQEEIYHSGLLAEPRNLNVLSQETPYSIIKNDKKSYFIVNKDSSYSSWSYFYSIPYDSIFYQFDQIKATGLLIFSLSYAVLSILTIYFANSLTRSLTRLAGRMDKISQINFETSTFSLPLTNRKDEIGQLQQSYSLMIKKIETLIKEDYVKQLVIKDHEYRTLQAQINPHFMYNTLDSIYWLAVNNKQNEIASMIFSIGKLLREAVKYDDNFNKLVTLREESQILDHYVTIQKIRLQEKLIFSKVFSEEACDCLLPKLILQPLIENSIAYGVESTGHTCIILLSAKIINHNLIITIEDNGIGIETNLLEKLESGERKPKGTGIGLFNIQSRLKIIYGDKSNLSIENAPIQGIIVTLTIPIDY